MEEGLETEQLARAEEAEQGARAEQVTRVEQAAHENRVQLMTSSLDVRGPRKFRNALCGRNRCITGNREFRGECRHHLGRNR